MAGIILKVIRNLSEKTGDGAGEGGVHYNDLIGRNPTPQIGAFIYILGFASWSLRI